MFKNFSWHNFFFPQDRLKSSSRLRRRSVPIHAYIGPNGSGKSLLMVYDTIPSLESGRKVLSTVRILDYKNPRLCDDIHCKSEAHGEHMAAHPNYIPLTNWKQLLNFRDGDVLLDEVQGVLSSREFSSLPAPIATMLLQLRRRNVALRWTAPNFARADKLLREVTLSVTVCEPFLAKKKKSKPGQPDAIWFERSAVLAMTYKAELVDEIDARKLSLGEETPIIRQFLFRKKFRWTNLTCKAYDTYDSITSISTPDSSGACLECGGSVTRMKCLCSKH